MIEPTEYERIHLEREVKDGLKKSVFKSSEIDEQVYSLNNFRSASTEGPAFLTPKVPISKESNKSLVQSHVYGNMGSQVSGYENPSAFTPSSSNASSKLSAYLDSRVQFIPEIMDTVPSIAQVPIWQPNLTPGIGAVDSRKLATGFS